MFFLYHSSYSWCQKSLNTKINQFPLERISSPKYCRLGVISKIGRRSQNYQRPVTKISCCYGIKTQGLLLLETFYSDKSNSQQQRCRLDQGVLLDLRILSCAAHRICMNIKHIRTLSIFQSNQVMETSLNVKVEKEFGAAFY